MFKGFKYSYRFICNKNCIRHSSQGNIWKERVFSGIQPTGTLHIGNYFGAVQNWVKLQNEKKDVIFSIVDLHSITLPQDPKTLHFSILQMTATLLACGIEPSKCILFQQSKVPEHTLLGWVLGTLTTMARLYHFPQYKEKSAALRDIPLGLFVYPVLQAGDILLYKATHVPVGDDQQQHLHLAQHLVHCFNNKYGNTFPLPQNVVVSDTGAQGGKIRSLREPEKKMSKSHTDPKSRIDISDSPDVILTKIKKAVTDFTSEVTYDQVNRPGVSNLIDILSLSTGKTVQEICAEASNLDTGRFKVLVADVLIEKLSPIRNRLQQLMDSPEYLEKVLDTGASQAKEIAENTWSEVSQKIGFQNNLILAGFKTSKAVKC